MRISPSPGRRKSRAPVILVILVLVLVAFLVWISTRGREVPTQRIEQDVTNEALAH
jgi:O-antigen ligase